MPQKITPEEARKLKLIPFGKKHAIRALLETLEVGEMLYIAREEFKWKKTTPNFFCKDIEKKTGKKFRIWKEPNKKGWVVERME